MRPDRIEYPDAAGYPDGMGFLDEGTADAAARSPLVSGLDRPSADADEDILIVEEPGAYRAVAAGVEVAVMRVDREGGTVTIRSTVVDPGARGRGIATDLIAHVLDAVRDDGLHVVVECPEVARFIGLHPEYADLQA
jgi:predicted GNAT family acetyltransferase